ncbi:MAG: STAS/SEC14 domain-containing protein [Desulfobacterales bacterium]|jgi:hypothetical protein
MIKYKIDKSQGIIFATISGNISLEEIMTHISDIINDSDFSSGYHSIITAENDLTIPYVKPDRIQIIQDVLNGYAEIRAGSKFAVVSSTGTTHAILKTALELIAPISANIRLFRDTNDAIAWLKD